MYSFLDRIYPEWHFKEFFSRNIMIPYAFITDASDSTRSMSSELITTSDINNSFDDIAYDKGSQLKYLIKKLSESN
jgi:aminopeptidase N